VAVGLCEHANEPSASIKGGVISDYKLHKGEFSS
jgi:hypothetical protein